MINPVHNYPVDFNQNQKIQKSADADIFKHALDKAVTDKTVDQGAAPDETHGASSTGELSEISSVQNIIPGESSDTIQIKTYELIEKLSKYAANIGNREVSLKEIEPLLDEIKSDAEELLQESEYAAKYSTDSSLIDIARHSAITANAEYIKFQRGDYL